MYAVEFTSHLASSGMICRSCRANAVERAKDEVGSIDRSDQLRGRYDADHLRSKRQYSPLFS